MRRALMAMAMLSALPPAALAQQPGTVYLAGGITVPYQQGATGESPQTYLTASGGWSVGMLAAGGVFVARHLALEAEWSRTGLMTSTQPSRYFMTFHDERREQSISFVARVSLLAGAVRIEPVGGVAITHATASTQVERTDFVGSPGSGVFEPIVEHDLDTRIGVTAGCDVRIGGGRLAVVPSFRVTDTGIANGRYDAGSETREIAAIYPGGYPQWSYRGALSLRVSFR